MTNVKRITLIALCLAATLPEGGLWAQQTGTSGQMQASDSVAIPARWDLQSCIDYALQQNISIRRNRINAQSTQVDVKTAKAALFPSLSFSSSQNLVNRPYQESSSIISGSEVLKSSNKTTYNGNYGLNAQWTVYNGSKRLKTIEQEKLNNRVADLDVATSENDIRQSIAQTYIQILYAAESVKVNENTLQVSEAQRDRGKQLLDAGSIARSDYAQLEAQVSTDRYQLVTAQATLQDYKLQLKQLLELDGEQEMQIYLPVLGDENVLSPLPTKADVFQAAVALRPEIEASKLSVEASELGIGIARSGYLPSVSLTAGIGTNHTSGSDFTFGEQVKNGWNNSIGLSISVPIFNNRQTKSAVEKAKLQYQTSQLTLLDEQKTLYKTIEGLWLRHEEYGRTAYGEEQSAASTAGVATVQVYGHSKHSTAEVLSGRRVDRTHRREQKHLIRINDMNKKKIILIAAGIVVLAGGGLWLFGSPTAKHKVTYTTATVSKGEISESVTATGTIEPVTEVEVGTQVSGIIDKIYVDYNAAVTKGQLIAEMDRVTLQSELASQRATYNGAKAEYEYQKKNYERSRGLHEKALISDTDYEQSLYNYEKAKSSFESSQASLAKAERNLSYATITSPIDGVVISRDVEEGQTVASGFETPTLFTIAADLTQMQVVADVDEADIGGVEEGQRATFTVDAYPNDVFEGTVTQIRLGDASSTSTSSTSTTVVTYEVVISAHNPDLKLKPRLTANVTIYTLDRKDVLSVPARALRFTPEKPLISDKDVVKDCEGEHKLWTREGNTFTAHPVQTGITNGINTEITGGASEGMVVVTEATIGSMPGGNVAPEAGPDGGGEQSPFMPSHPGSKKKGK